MVYTTFDKFEKYLDNSLVLIPLNSDSVQNKTLYNFDDDTEQSAIDIICNNSNSDLDIIDFINSIKTRTTIKFISSYNGLVNSEETIKNPPIDLITAITNFKIHKIITKQLIYLLSQNCYKNIIFMLSLDPDEELLLILKIIENYDLKTIVSTKKINLMYACPKKSNSGKSIEIEYHKFS